MYSLSFLSVILLILLFFYRYYQD
ncbi:MAG TPA: hypothetical protein DE042_02015 [Colwellia sp.]|nr:hypothetical protein [Colwellia sp.]